METHSNERVEGPLDYPITDEEFEAAINKLKAKRLAFPILFFLTASPGGSTDKTTRNSHK